MEGKCEHQNRRAILFWESREVAYICVCSKLCMQIKFLSVTLGILRYIRQLFYNAKIPSPKKEKKSYLITYLHKTMILSINLFKQNKKYIRMSLAEFCWYIFKYSAKVLLAGTLLSNCARGTAGISLACLLQWL